ncbi:MAG TPA: glycosyl hydrolase family 28-related protein [Capsulimonadaceae bacterium]|nr:glycosyl hydrolase family 28-related protein [Capsulimonadaceae bacterium]
MPFRAFSCFLSFLIILAICSISRADQNPAGVIADGSTDDTAALQTALDQAGKTGGSVVLSPGLYLIKGNLTVPTGVTLQGSWEAPHHGAWDKGTTLLITGGRGQENGQAAITLLQSSALRGVTMVWPDEKADNIVPYPWAIHGYGMHNSIENVTLINAYQGILIGQPGSELHLIRNVFGCVLRRGIFIDSTSDVGRIENIHFNTHYWPRSNYPPIQLPGGKDTGSLVTRFTMKNLEAFIFGRADWEYVENTFVWGAHIGYHFIRTDDGACNGQFMGIGADACNTGLQVDHIQGIGIQVTNGEFTAFTGLPNAGVVISPNATGAAQFVNCNFWSTPGGAVQVHGNTQVTINACHFVDSGKPGEVVADNGHVIVNSCSFGAAGTAVALKPGTRSAIITSNSQSGGLIVDNEIGGAAQIGLNETASDVTAAH